jgi:HSP20 family molecular chaperone IbpA
MAYILTPRFVPVQAPQCGPFGFCAPQPRSYGYRVARPQPRRPTYSSFNHFFHQVDELLTDIGREAQRQAALEAHIEAQREAHRQRQQRKRALRANFNVNQTEQGWEVDGDIHGFEQQNINIEVTDAQTLKISGNTRWEPEQSQPEPAQQPSIEKAPATEQTSDEHMDGVTLNEPETETTTEHDSDTESHKSYQATVEDDFEDLGAETASLISASSTSTVAEEQPKEPKGKEKAVEETPAEAQPETVTTENQEQPQEQERVHGSFERTLRFPARIDAANVTAHFEGGVLKINVPKAEVEQVRRIAIL